MTNEIVRKTGNLGGGKIHDLLSNHSVEDVNKVNLKREQFLALLKTRYSYTNEKAVDELERLLKQFYRMNKSLNIHLPRPFTKHLPVE